MKNDIKIKRFINYDNLCLFISQLAHDYDRLGYEKFMQKEYNCHGMYKQYLIGFRDYWTRKETGKVTPRPAYKGKFILDPLTYYEYFKFKNKSILNEIEPVPELYSQGFIMESVQQSVLSIARENGYTSGF